MKKNINLFLGQLWTLAPNGTILSREPSWCNNQNFSLKFDPVDPTTNKLTNNGIKMEIIGTSVKEVGTSANAVATIVTPAVTTVKPEGTPPKALDTIVNPKVTSVKPEVKPAGSRRKRSNQGEPSTESDTTTLWKKGPLKDPFFTGGNKYFTITNLYNQKVLTAVDGTPASLEIKGKPKHTNLPVKLFAGFFKSRHCSRLIASTYSNLLY